jgi:tetratricopeptide (TPR) repeat protein
LNYKLISTNYSPGFKFRSLNYNNIFYNDNLERLVQSYQLVFIRLAVYYNETGQKNKAIEVLDLGERTVPRTHVSMDFRLLFDIGNIYNSVGATEKYRIIANEVEKYSLQALNENPNDVQLYYNPYRLLIEIYNNTKQYSKAINIYNRMKIMYPNDKSHDDEINRLRNLQAHHLNNFSCD